MAAYSAFVKVIHTNRDGAQEIVSKQFDNPNEYLLWVDEATAALNSDIANAITNSYTIIQKVNGQILDVEHVDYDSRNNFQIRKTPNA